jgi:uncharacterized coiled-coil protein SlyX
VSEALIEEYSAGGAGSLADRRRLAERLRRHLARLDAEIEQQEAAPAEQPAGNQPSVSQLDLSKSYADLFANQARSATGSGDPNAVPQPSLQEIAEALRQQQAMIERLTRVLESLHSKLNAPASNFAPATPTPDSTGDVPDPGNAAATPQQDAKLKRWEERLEQANANVDDATYLRRVMLDLAGVPPTAEQVRRFLESAAPDKRKQLLEELLNLASPEALDLLDAWQDELRPDVPE